MSEEKYGAKVIEDSVTPKGVRLTTLEVVHPRFILAEVNTHRVLTRNSESSRAVPPAKRIKLVREEPFVPVFGSRVKGMGQGDDLDPGVQTEAQQIWKHTAQFCADQAEKLDSLGVDKSHINRIIENFTWHRALITATYWENFFALRDHPDAQNEFGILACLMRDALRDHDPKLVDYGDWHEPLVSDSERQVKSDRDPLFTQYASAGRCARVSYNRHSDPETLDVSYDRAIGLRNSGHMSPLEHVAMVDSEYGGYYDESNFDPQWVQLRKMIPDEDNFAQMQLRQEEA